MTDLLHVYAFGSICRGEISAGSDIDLLAVTTGPANELSRSQFSIYSHSKIARIWEDGNPFAWHLHLESRLIYSSDSRDFISTLGPPATYSRAREDCERFLALFSHARASANCDRASVVFDLSAAFLGLRNFSSCYLLGRGHPDFSRSVALTLMGKPLLVDIQSYRVLERARLLCTRGFGVPLSPNDILETLKVLPKLEEWMLQLLSETTNGQQLLK